MATGLCTHGGSLLGDDGAEGVLSGVEFEYQGGEGTQCIVCVCVWGGGVLEKTPIPEHYLSLTPVHYIT